jgi:hypothetical protein
LTLLKVELNILGAVSLLLLGGKCFMAIGAKFESFRVDPEFADACNRLYNLEFGLRAFPVGGTGRNLVEFTRNTAVSKFVAALGDSVNKVCQVH